MTLRWTPTALRDMESLMDYIAVDSPAAARNMAEKILSGIEALCLQPGMGRRGRVAGTRELVIPPYMVAYRVTGGAIELLAIIHGARRWPDAL